MSHDIRTEEPSSRAWWVLSVAVIGLLLVWLLAVAVRVTVDYYDAFELLAFAKSLAYSGRYGYSLLHPLLMPVLLAPWFLLERVLPLGNFAQTACHVMSVLWFAMLLRAFYRLLRRDVTPQWAAVGTLCLGLNPLVVHSAPFVMKDIPATLFTTLAFSWYLKGSEPGQERRWILAGLFLAMAATARYNLIPLPLLVIGGYELISGRIRSGSGMRLAVKLCALVVWPCVLFWLLPLVVYPVAHLASWWQAPARFTADFLNNKRVFESSQHLPPRLNYRFLVESLTWPLALGSIIGMVAAARRRLSGAWFHGLWFAIFFLAHTYVVQWKEARYLYPLFPPLYYFVVLGLKETVGFIRDRVSANAIRPLVGGACLALALVQPAYLAVRECYRFTDPEYRADFERQVSLYAKGCAGDHPIVWIGPFYPLHPAEYVFDRADANTYIYHFAAHIVRYYTGNPVSIGPGLTVLQFGSSGEAIYPGPGVIRQVEDGTVLIVNTETSSYVTWSLPAKLKPLVVERLRILRFAPVANENGNRTFTSPDLPFAKLSLSVTDDGWSLAGEGLPPNWYYLFADTGGSQPEFISAGRSDSPRPVVVIPRELMPAVADVKGLALYYFDCFKTFTVASQD